MLSVCVGVLGCFGYIYEQEVSVRHLICIMFYVGIGYVSLRTLKCVVFIRFEEDLVKNLKRCRSGPFDGIA